MSKTVWIINQYASTTNAGMAGRHFYFAKELAKQGHDVYLIASSANHLLRNPPHISENFKLEKVDGFTFVWVRMPEYAEAHSKQRALNWFLFPWRLQSLPDVILTKPDAILCSSPSLLAFLGAQRLARRFNARLIFEVRDIWPLTLTELGGYSPNHLFIRLMQWVEDRAYRDSDYVISNLKNAVEHMVSRGMNREKFSWVPNGFSLGEVSNPEMIEKSIRDQIPKNKFIIGYTGTFGLANSLDTLVDAAEILKDYEDIVFFFVGGGRDKRSLVEYVGKKKLTNIQFLDYVKKTQIQSILSLFDVLAVGAKKNPLYQFGVAPNKLYDYMISGQPIIYYIESGDYKPVVDSGCGYEVLSESPLALADAILKLYNMPLEERRSMGLNGRKAAIELYEYGMLTKKLENIIFGQRH